MQQGEGIYTLSNYRNPETPNRQYGGDGKLQLTHFHNRSIIMQTAGISFVLFIDVDDDKSREWIIFSPFPSFSLHYTNGGIDDSSGRLVHVQKNYER